MRLGHVFVLVAVLVIGSSAGANILVHDGTTFDWEITTPTAVGDGSENLVAFVLRVVNMTADSDKNPNAIDAARDPNTGGGFDGIYTVSEPLLHNEQYALKKSFSRTASLTQWVALGWGSPDVSPLDTYFLVEEGGLTAVFLPEEGPLGPENPAGPYWEPPYNPSAETPFWPSGQPGDICGFLDSLTGTFGLKGPNANAYWDLAYIVVPEPILYPGSSNGLWVDAQVAGGDGSKEVGHFQILIPVPAAFAPMLLGAGLIMTRRRAA